MEVKKLRKEKINDISYLISHLDFESSKENLMKFISENKITNNIKLIYISNFKKINIKAFDIFFKIKNIKNIDIYTTRHKHISLKNKKAIYEEKIKKSSNKNQKNIVFFMIEINSNCKMYDGKFINKKLSKIIKYSRKKKLQIGLISNSTENHYISNIKTAFTDLDEDISNIVFSNLQKNLYDSYTFIYDKVCEKLDQNFMVNNFCKFENDKCVANRDTDNIEQDNGCCHSFIRNKNIKAHKTTEELTLCSHLGEDKSCQIKCISCKFFVCQYLKDRGVYLDILDNFLLRSTFSRKQLDVIHINFFKTEDAIVKKLIKVKKNILPYKLFILFKGQLIDNYWGKTPTIKK